MQTFREEANKIIRKFEALGKTYEITLYKIKCNICGSMFESADKSYFLCEGCKKKSDRYNELAKIRLPEGYGHMKFKTFEVNDKNKKAYDCAKEFFVSPKGLYIYGGVGTGKTHLLVSAFKRALWDSNAELLDALKLFSKISKGWDIQKKERELETYYKAEYLFLDDLGSEKISEHNIEIMIMLLNERIQRGKKKVFITSNCDYETLSKNTDDRITSRIIDLCWLPVKIEGEDYRLKVAKKGVM